MQYVSILKKFFVQDWPRVRVPIQEADLLRSNDGEQLKWLSKPSHR
jgi:hypothetical protein